MLGSPASSRAGRRPLPPRAFTLIELLLVISIIAVLASMLLPAVGLVRQAAQATACASGQRQIALAGITYASERDGLLPLIAVAGVNGSAWLITLAGYLDAAPDNATSTWEIYPNSIYLACKAAPTGGSGKVYEARLNSVASHPTMWEWRNNGGIGMNQYPGRVPGNGGKDAYYHNVALSTVTHKSNRAFLGDGLNYRITAGDPGPYNCSAPWPGPAWDDHIYLGWKYCYADPERHRGKMNVAFYDGRVQAVPAATAYLTFHDPANFK